MPYDDDWISNSWFVDWFETKAEPWLYQPAAFILAIDSRPDISGDMDCARAGNKSFSSYQICLAALTQ